MMDIATPKTADFYKAIRALKQLHPRFQLLALHAAQFWSDERLTEAEQADLQPGQAKPEKSMFQ
jgi:hypothetical protein